MVLLRLRRSILARTRPSTTGFTHSRWLGLNAIDRWTGRPPPVTTSLEYPRWYFTSPAPRNRSGFLSSNAAKISRTFLPMTLTSTFRRPRCAMPMTSSSMPWVPAASMSRSMRGIRLSAPSSEKRLAPT